MVDFSKIPYINIEGNTELADIRKPLGNTLYYQSNDIKGSDLGHTIYKSEGGIEVTDEERKIIINMLPVAFNSFIIRKAIEEALKN